jgi:drug/metabolite transporter (DMT)-like permease
MSTKATLALLVVTVSWGWSFVWMDDVLAAGQRVAPGSLWETITLFMVIRFALATLTVPFFVRGSLRRFTRRELRSGCLLAALLVAGFLLQMWGLDRVTPPVSAFLTSLYVFFTLVFSTVAARKAPARGLVVGAILATFGAGFISGPPHVNFGLGETLTVGCAFFFALHILATDRFTKEDSPAALTFISFAATTVLTGLALLVAVASNDAVDSDALVEIATAPDFITPTILSSVFATTLALTLMNFYQRHMPPVRAAILYALEPVWATCIAFGLGRSEATLWLFVGGGALLLGNLLAETMGRKRASEAYDEAI